MKKNRRGPAVSSTRLLACPACQGEDIDIESSAELGMTKATCLDCGHSYARRCCEENMPRYWNAHVREANTNSDKPKEA